MSNPDREFQVFAKPVGGRCNLDCRYCYYSGKEKLSNPSGAGLMQDDILENYIRQHITATTSRQIFFSWHGGEPTLAGLDFYRKIVDIQKGYKPCEKTVINGIQTNATLITDEWCEFLAKEGFYVGVSIDGDEKFHDIFRVSKNGGPTFKKTYAGYKRLVKHNIKTEILCVVNSENAGAPLEIYKFLKNLGSEYLTFLPRVEKSPTSPALVSERSVRPEDFGNFLCTIFDDWMANDIGKIKIQIIEEAVRTAFNQEHTLCIFKKTCGGVPVVEYNGDFYDCDHYVDREHYVGNIRNMSLSQMLDSPVQMKFGQAKLDLLPDYCLNCEVRDMCNGECPKNRFLNTPSGEPGLNFLCDGYKKFFLYIKPFIEAVRNEWQQQKQ
jgi:uncharacterized protein